MAACDPAQPYGAALAWPDNAGRPSRSIGAYIVLRDGHPLAFLERGGRSLTLFERASEDPSWVEPLLQLVRSRTLKGLEITKINGQPPAENPELRDLLLENGFKPGYRGPTFKR